jgi:hypothetical protein
VLFNTFAAPFLATAFISTNCFNGVVVSPKDIKVSFDYGECTFFNDDNVCIEYADIGALRTSSYLPPFTYSYQCSSTFISTYSTVYLGMLIFATFGSPLMDYLWLKLYNLTTSGSYLNIILDLLVPNALRDPHAPTENVALSVNHYNFAVFLSRFKSSRLIAADVLVVNLINLFTILLSFGFVFPPIALMVLAAVCSLTFTTQLQINIYVSNTHDENTRNEHIEFINTSTTHAHNMFVNSVWIVLPFTVVFYSYLLFDILGDDVGWQKAIWLPVTTLAFSVVCGAIYALLQSPRAAELKANLTSCCVRAPRHTRGSYSGVQMEDELNNPITENLVEEGKK